MSNTPFEHYVRTNQKLYFTRLALTESCAAETDPAIGALARAQAAREAAIFHLYGACLSLCQEIFTYYHIATQHKLHLEEFLRRKWLVDIPCPELSELILLAEQPSSWLVGILDAYEKIHHPEPLAEPAKVDPSIALIAVVDLDVGGRSAGPSITQINVWCVALEAVAVRFRYMLVEW